MRGARHYRAETLADCRIIPADAGSTPKGDNATIKVQDHPRGCGEHR